MRKRRVIVLLALSMVLALGGAAVAQGQAAPLSDMEELGKFLFFDENLSANGNQSCASCHGPQVGYTGPTSRVNATTAVYEGSIPGEFGDRKPPAAAYGGGSPVLFYDEVEGVWTGGMFWDGRATGWTLGDPLAEQAQGPFLNPKEHALPDKQAVIDIVKASDYAALFEQVWGPGALLDADAAYDSVGLSIAAYERSAELNPYSSKYDAYLAGEATLSRAEQRGMDLFFGEAKCSLCHSGPDFTDYTYANLGVPKNPLNPVYDYNPDFVDEGLGGFLRSAGEPAEVYGPEIGKVKVPTLRNVGLRWGAAPSGGFVKAYAHNGYFKDLWEIVHFYNTRDVAGAKWRGQPWPEPEVAENINTTELGDLGLTRGQERDIVSFMETLSDGYQGQGRRGR